MDGAALSDLLVEKTREGHVSLRNVTTDSDVTLSGIQGDVTVAWATIGGDVHVYENAGDIELRGISARLEDVLVSKNGGEVVIDSSCDLTLTVVENREVVIANNNPAAAAAAGVACDSAYLTGSARTTPRSRARATTSPSREGSAAAPDRYTIRMRGFRARVSRASRSAPSLGCTA